jgi:putative transposase
MVKNHKLARVISDAGWRMLLTFLEYKCSWYGRELIKVDRFYPSSKTCSACGHIVEHLPLEVRSWVCPACKAEHDRDENAAHNILAAGLAVSACGPDVSHGVLRNAVQSGMNQEARL